MPRQLHLEGPALEPLLEQARAEHGEQVTVVSAQRVRSGGFAGFFSREHFELTIDVSTGEVSEGGSAPGPRALTAGSSGSSGSSAFASSGSSGSSGDVLADLLAAADDADRADGGHATGTGGSAALDAALDAALFGGRGDEVVLGARRPGRPLSTEGNGFDEMLAALQSQLLGPGPAGEVSVPEPVQDPTAAPAESFAPWQPVVLADDGEHPAPSVGSTPVPTLSPIKVAPSAPVTPVSPVPYAGTVLIGPRRGQPLVPTVVPEPLGTTQPGAQHSSTEQLSSTAQLSSTEQLSATERTVTHQSASSEEVVPGGTRTTQAERTVVHERSAAVRLDTAAATVEVQTPAAAPATVPGSAPATVPGAAPATLSATDLVALGRLVGADPTTAAVAAAEVATSGCTSMRLALPMLATALAEEVAEPDGTDASGDAGGPPALTARAGDLVLVVGSPDRVRRAAQDVADELGTPWVARWCDETDARPRSGAPTVGEGRRLPLMRTRARRDGQPLVVEVPDETLRDTVTPRRAGTGRTDLIRTTAPDLVVLAVDADSSVRRQAAVTSRVSDACEDRPLLLSLVGCARASAPLVHSGWPVVLLDGRPATVGTWTGVLLDALRWAESA